MIQAIEICFFLSMAKDVLVEFNFMRQIFSDARFYFIHVEFNAKKQ